MRTLDEIAIDCGTDKASKHPVKGHDYARHYAKFFDPIRFDTLKILEIGVGGGESIRTWMTFFEMAEVYGVDIVKNTNPWNTIGYGTPRYRFVSGDQSDKTFWECFKADYGKDWDIIIDDGGHKNSQIIPTFESMWPAMAHGGLYCVEDIGVAYGTLFVDRGFPNHIEWIKSVIDTMHTGETVDSIYMAPELAIFRHR